MSLLEDAPPLHPAYDNTLGAELIGLLLCILLYGIFLMQVYVYFQTFDNDTKWLKYTIYTIIVLSTLSTVFLCVGLYYYLVTNYANPSSLHNGVWSWTYLPILIALITFIVELFFAIRVYRLSGYQKKMLVLILALSVVSNGIKIAATVLASLHPNEGPSLRRSEQIVACASLAGTVACGSIIAFLQTYYLYKGKTGVERTDRVVNVLITYTISTGLLTSILASFGLAFFAAMPKNTIYWASCSVSAGTYSNALLASLNGRRHLRSEMSGNNTVASNLLGSELNPPIFMNNKSWMSIVVDTTKETFISLETAPDRSISGSSREESEVFV